MMNKEAQLGMRKPVAIIDIGSNSIRLVIYENLTRALTPLYNEKSICSLGKGVALDGNLAEQNIEKALKVMARFSLVMKLMNVEQAYCFATSAVREAKNGKDFAQQISTIIGVNVEVLTGEQEAHFAALGTYAGMPDFNGVIGDLGGGSLELSSLGLVNEEKQETYQLGVLQLIGVSENSLKEAVKITSKQLKNSDVLKKKSQNFCAIGGTWRQIAKLHQIQTNYPLHMVQNYQVDAKEMQEFCDKIITQFDATNTYDGIEFVSSTRVGLLPFGAIVLKKILRTGTFENVVFSALGVREGYLFNRLEKTKQQKDPLLEICENISLLRSRSHPHSFELIKFSKQFIGASKLSEDVEQQRLREAACFLADIAWRGHPDYKGEQAIDLIAFGALIGVNHAGRAFLARTLAVRYMGLKRHSVSSEILDLAGENNVKRAKILGALFRVAFVISASMAGVLPKVAFNINNQCLELILPQDLLFLEGSRLKNRLGQLAKTIGLQAGEIVISRH